ncbi:response regulator [Alkaliphilus serpentinus]|uniref:Stage 0 sporulation protein A homolog n=1 Tax=Alkaliphilus serpentinus TaxID=1482731 RepID=A0A833HLJ8_9FIRM|nr:response regulator [Alkaliphilus serpentinus]KAB3525935.1 response regulator [Alkaliphilus serpentinus]
MNKNILFVDDEEQILKSLRRVFNNSKYNIFTANGGEEALIILNSEKIDLLVTDVIMSGISGYQLLEKAKDRFPSTIRLVLSGHMDEGTLLKIKRSSLAKLYLLKPWKNQELVNTIEQIFKVEDLLKNKKLLELINKIDCLPTPEKIYDKVNSLIKQDADMKVIAEVIERDPSIAAKILEIVNSSFYGIQTGSIKQAIIYLGLTNVQNIILSTSTFKALEGIKNMQFHRDIKMIWTHSAITNKILSFLYSRLLHKKIPDTCAVAGLLHDIGKVILLNNFTDEYLKVTSGIKNNQDAFYYFEEMEFLEPSHQEIGGFLLNWWELPHPIVESALFHHNPFDELVINKELVSLVHIADIYSWSIICKCHQKEIDEKVLKLFNITMESCDQLIKEIKFDTYR